MLIGYARVSTQDQTLDLQRDALTKAGCSKIFTDTVSGAATERPGLSEALQFVRDGDILVVWKLDRLGRSLAVIVNVLDPDVIVLGGGLSNVARFYETVPPRIKPHVFGDKFLTRLVPNRHGDSSGVRGAAWL